MSMTHPEWLDLSDPKTLEEMEEKLRKAAEEIQRQVAALEQVKKVTRATMELVITI